MESIAKTFKRGEVIGRRFGRLVVIAVERKVNGRTYWLCECDCGKQAIVDRCNLGLTRSCGCLRREANRKRLTTHGMSPKSKNGRPEYRIWSAMKSRCHCVTDHAFYMYGGRGIIVCDEWIHSFSKFFEDMGPRPEGLTLDRIDNNKGYSKENCRWATRATQANNRRANRLITHNGTTATIAEWSVASGLPQKIIGQRVRRGWAVEDALTAPIGSRKKPA